MIHKRKKNSWQRGTKTHGCGSMKKRRGKGNKGGAGMAGTGKRGDARKPTILKQKGYFGKHGFNNANPIKVNSINISFIEEKIAGLLSSGIAKESQGIVKLDISELGFDKLLGNGAIVGKYEIKCKIATSKAVSKIESAGGKVILAPATKPASQPKDINTDSAADEEDEASGQ